MSTILKFNTFHSVQRNTTTFFCFFLKSKQSTLQTHSCITGRFLRDIFRLLACMHQIQPPCVQSAVWPQFTHTPTAQGHRACVRACVDSLTSTRLLSTGCLLLFTSAFCFYRPIKSTQLIEFNQMEGRARRIGRCIFYRKKIMFSTIVVQSLFLFNFSVTYQINKWTLKKIDRWIIIFR